MVAIVLALIAVAASGALWEKTLLAGKADDDI